jgi:flagellar hook protein FlgE
VSLIAAQRNFQSNAKALETSGALASTLINMRG